MVERTERRGARAGSTGEATGWLPPLPPFRQPRFGDDALDDSDRATTGSC